MLLGSNYIRSSCSIWCLNKSVAFVKLTPKYVMILFENCKKFFKSNELQPSMILCSFGKYEAYLDKLFHIL